MIGVSMAKVTVGTQLAKKMRLEDKLKPKLRKFFSQISEDVRTVWVATGSIPNLRSFNLELVAILRTHYRLVAKAFKNTTRDSLGKSALPFLERKQEETRVSETVDRDILTLINEHSQQQSDFILMTTERNLQNIATKVITAASIAGLVLPAAESGAQIQEAFEKNSDSRVNTISITETQGVSELTKFLEAKGIAATLTGTQEIFKTWNTVLDEKTRLSHVQADRQRVRLETAHTVQGQSLRFPGDASLGATGDNRFGCRCSDIYNLTGQESAPLDIPRQEMINVTPF